MILLWSEILARIPFLRHIKESLKLYTLRGRERWAIQVCQFHYYHMTIGWRNVNLQFCIPLRISRTRLELDYVGFNNLYVVHTRHLGKAVHFIGCQAVMNLWSSQKRNECALLNLSRSKGVLNVHKQRTRTITAATRNKPNRKSLIAYKRHSLVYEVIYQDCQQTRWLPTRWSIIMNTTKTV